MVSHNPGELTEIITFGEAEWIHNAHTSFPETMNAPPSHRGDRKRRTSERASTREQTRMSCLTLWAMASTSPPMGSRRPRTRWQALAQPEISLSFQFPRAQDAHARRRGCSAASRDR